MTVILETPRLALRRLEEGDLDDLARLYADEDVRRFYPSGTLDRARTKEELDWFAGGGDPAFPKLGLWAVIHKPSGRFAGRAGFLPWAIDGRYEIEIAYLLDKALWGQGLGAELAAGLVEHGLTTLALPRLVALILPGNDASVRTAERAGLRFERETHVDGVRCRLHAISVI